MRAFPICLVLVSCARGPSLHDQQVAAAQAEWATESAKEDRKLDERSARRAARESANVVSYVPPALADPKPEGACPESPPPAPSSTAISSPRTTPSMGDVLRWCSFRQVQFDGEATARMVPHADPDRVGIEVEPHYGVEVSCRPDTPSEIEREAQFIARPEARRRRAIKTTDLMTAGRKNHPEWAADAGACD